METSGTENAHYNISSGSVEVNFEEIDRVGDYATLTVEDRDPNTYASVEKRYMNDNVGKSPDEENDTQPEEGKDRTTMIASPKERMYIGVLTAVILLLVISVGIIVFLLVSSKSEETDYCRSNPCVHGTCISNRSNYTCYCTNGFFGPNCGTDHCASNPCYHGRCESTANGFKCVCDNDFTGATCDTNHCASNPCYHGRCESTANGFKCVCDNDFTGATCDTRINMCDTIQCVHGTCYDNSEGFVCVCATGYEGLYCENSKNTVATDCYDVYYKNVSKRSGVYNVTLWESKKTIQVYCDMDTFPYGWTVFQKRFDGSVDFYQNFSQYTNGFGSVHGELWLGLRYVEELASQYESDLRVDLTAAGNSRRYEQFENFSLSKYPDFTLRLGRQTVEQISDNEDGFYRCAGHPFSTYDHDVDSSSNNCAQTCHGGWWYWNCIQSNLNGEYMSPPGSESSFANGHGGFIYYAWQGRSTLKSSKIMIRKHY